MQANKQVISAFLYTCTGPWRWSSAATRHVHALLLYLFTPIRRCSSLPFIHNAEGNTGNCYRLRRFNFYARKQLLFSARLSHRNCLSVCLSVRLSVTRVDQSKTAQARITKSSPSAAWKTLVSGSVKLFHKLERGHPSEDTKWEWGVKFSILGQ